MSQANDNPSQRIFKIGATRIIEDDSMTGRTIEEVQAQLQRHYPEVANATYRTRQEGDTLFVEFIPRPGRKG